MMPSFLDYSWQRYAYAVDLINLSPSAPLDGDVPEKFGLGKIFLIYT